WTYDALRLNGDGLVVPIIEAVRPGYRYFSLANVHGLYLRGTGEFKRPPREAGESSASHRTRIEEARAAWWKAASPKGTLGQVSFWLDMRMVLGEFAVSERADFYEMSEYNNIGA